MTAELITPGSDQFHALFRSFTSSAFRLETLQSYGASGEDAAFEAFQAGEPYTRHPGKEVWLDHLDRADRIGAVMSRVHVLAEPLSDYVRFETTWAYAPNVDAGEDIRIVCLTERDSWPSGVSEQDFWLFDDARLYAMHYAESGTFLGVERVHDEGAIARARRARDAAWQMATPWQDWIAQRPDLTPLVPTVRR